MAAVLLAAPFASTPNAVVAASLTGSAVAALLIGLLILPARGKQAEAIEALDRELDREAGATLSVREATPQSLPPIADLLARAQRSASELSAARQSQEREIANARAMLDAVVSPVIATDSSGQAVMCNNATLAFFGKRPAPVVGSAIDELFSQSEVRELHAGAMAGQVRQAQLRFPRPEGVRVYQVVAAPFQMVRPGAAVGMNETGMNETGVLLSLRDVTELAMALQLKTDFVANASHELRTPLSSIRAAVETLADGAWDDAAMRQKFAGMIQNNVVRLEELVRDLLDLSRLESPDAPVNIEVVRTDAIAESLTEVFEAAASERRLTIAFELDPRVQTLHTDAKLLTLVLKNLIDNSIKYAYADTTVRVVGTILPGEQAGSTRRLGVRFDVIDRGLGIPIGHQARVFQRFYQVDAARTGSPAKRGTGLGLAIVKHAVKRLGGTVGVESVWKEGTTMRVDLPDCVE
jgi:two-component system, OmpR family, phosphate regulon sensor histidine kinase PhoR